MKVKIISVIGNVINLSVDGVPYSYYITRPTPLTSQEAQLLYEQSFFHSTIQSYNEIRPWSNKLQDVFKRFAFQLRKRKTFNLSDMPFIYDAFVSWVRRNAIPLSVEGQDCFVLTPDMLDKIEKGEI